MAISASVREPPMSAIILRSALAVACLAATATVASAQFDVPRPRVILDLSVQEFAAADERFRRNGLSLVDLTAFSAAGGPRYAAVWTDSPRPPRRVALELTADEFRAADEASRRDGLRPVRVAGVRVRGRLRYAGIWERSPGPATRVELGLPVDTVQAVFEGYFDRGFRLAEVSVANLRGEDRYSAIFERAPAAEQISRNRLDRRAYFELFDDLAARGYRLRTVSGCFFEGVDLYAAIWERDGGPPIRARCDLTAAEFAAAEERYAAEGFSTARVSAYSSPGGPVRYAGIWEEAAGPRRVRVLRPPRVPLR